MADPSPIESLKKRFTGMAAEQQAQGVDAWFGFTLFVAELIRAAKAGETHEDPSGHAIKMQQQSVHVAARCGQYVHKCWPDMAVYTEEVFRLAIRMGNLLVDGKWVLADLVSFTSPWEI